jgi:sugar lactone lactonase YvrE
MDRITRLALILVLSIALPAPAAKLTLVAGGDGKDAAKLAMPFGVEFDAFGTMYVTEFEKHRIVTIGNDNKLTVVAGTGSPGELGDGGPAGKAMLRSPHNTAVTPEGIIYIADTMNNKVRVVGIDRNIRTLAGTGKQGASGDGGPATKAEFAEVYCVTLDAPRNRLLLADLKNHRVRAIDLKTNKVTTLAGNGTKGIPRDGEKATEQPLVDPRAVAADKAGTIYILERGGHALRAVAPDGTIRTVINKNGKPGAVTSATDALAAKLNGPKHLCVDSTGDVFIADTENHAIVKYRPKTGQVTRVAGTGTAGKAGIGGPPDRAQLDRPHGVTLSRDGTLFIADSHNNRIVRIDP